MGRHLVAHLRACGDEVVALRGDVTDAVSVRDQVRAAAPQCVYHLAALSHIGASWDSPQQVFRVNAEGTLNVLRACLAAGVERVLVVGSADVYGAVAEEDLPITEDAPLRPLTPYGASKVAADFLALQAYLGEGLGTIRVRAFNHTGPGQSEEFLVPSIARRVVEAERTGQGRVEVGSLDAVRDFTDVRDVVVAYRMLQERGEPGEVYNVCSGVHLSVREVAQRLLALAGVSLELVVDPRLVRPVEVPRLVGDNSKLRRATGWEPRIPLDQTLRDVLADCRAH